MGPSLKILMRHRVNMFRLLRLFWFMQSSAITPKSGNLRGPF